MLAKRGGQINGENKHCFFYIIVDVEVDNGHIKKKKKNHKLAEVLLCLTSVVFLFVLFYACRPDNFINGRCFLFITKKKSVQNSLLTKKKH